jgi:hypothetical protein
MLALLAAALGVFMSPATGICEELAFAGHRVASAAELGSMRGGFLTSAGGAQLELAFGIERTVTIDGEVVGSTQLRIPSLARLDALRPVALDALQVGLRNAVGEDVRTAGNLALIQNSLDGQVLRQVTTIDASVRNLEVFRAARFADALNQQMVMSLR